MDVNLHNIERGKEVCLDEIKLTELYNPHADAYGMSALWPDGFCIISLGRGMLIFEDVAMRPFLKDYLESQKERALIHLYPQRAHFRAIDWGDD